MNFGEKRFSRGGIRLNRWGRRYRLREIYYGRDLSEKP